MNRYLHLSIYFIALIGCSTPQEEENLLANDYPEIVSLIIPDTSINLNLLVYDRMVSVWSLNKKPFSGYAESYFKNGIKKKRFGLLNGKMQNEAIEWYINGKIRDKANYHEGKLHGEKKTWTPDSAHFLISHLNYYLGKVHGEQKKWYPTGELFQILNLEMGKEEGIQKAFRKNGVIYANYEAKRGRIFGLKKAALCFGLENQKIIDEK